MLVRVESSPWYDSRVMDFEREIDDLLGSFFGREFVSDRFVVPQVDVAEYDNKYVLFFEVPGVAKEEVKISIREGTIQVSGKRKQVPLPEKAAWVRSEARSGEFSRVLEVPRDVKLSEISAELTDGILRVVLPKNEAAQPREISIQ